MECTLDKLPIDKKGIIKSLNCNNIIRRRILDLGFVVGTQITPVLNSPAKGLRAFYARGSLIALRDEDSSLINIIF